jgi:hypothetical protein
LREVNKYLRVALIFLKHILPAKRKIRFSACALPRAFYIEIAAWRRNGFALRQSRGKDLQANSCGTDYTFSMLICSGAQAGGVTVCARNADYRREADRPEKG